MLLNDRILDFSESKEEEWELLRSKISKGVELPLPDSERWFLATVDGEHIKIESAKLNVRPLVLHEPYLITFEEFERIAEHYNNFHNPDAQNMSKNLDIQKAIPNLKFIFMLVYYLL